MVDIKKNFRFRNRFEGGIEFRSKKAWEIMCRTDKNHVDSFPFLKKQKFNNHLNFSFFLIKKISFLLVAVCFCTLVTAQTVKPASLEESLEKSVQIYPSIKINLEPIPTYSVTASKSDWLPVIMGVPQLNSRHFQLSELTDIPVGNLALGKSGHLENIRAAINGDTVFSNDYSVIKLDEAGTQMGMDRSVLVKNAVLLNFDPLGPGLPRTFGGSNYSRRYSNPYPLVLPYKSYSYPFGIGISLSIISHKANPTDPDIQ